MNIEVIEVSATATEVNPLKKSLAAQIKLAVQNFKTENPKADVSDVDVHPELDVRGGGHALVVVKYTGDLGKPALKSKK